MSDERQSFPISREALTAVLPSYPSPTDPGRMLRAFGAIAMRIGHLDNTGAPCRIEWDGDHDCCYVCNVNSILLAAMRDHRLDADALAKRMPGLTLADLRAAEREAAP